MTFDELPQFHSCFEISVENCGTVEKKATNSSTTVVVYIYTTVVVTVDQMKVWWNNCGEIGDE